jgi:hypothetical protein
VTGRARFMKHRARSAADIQHRLRTHDQRQVEIEVRPHAPRRHRIVESGKLDVGKQAIGHDVSPEPAA